MKPSQKAPALFSEPSIPSVSAAKAVIFNSFSIDNAKDNKNSVFLPPRPGLSCISTVVSPPDKITAGVSKMVSLSFLNFAKAACMDPTSDALPSIESDKI